ncbi:MAG TPA: alpha/beta hydrolase domain-containing protein [Acidimicrobiia bacterium]
MRSALLAVLGAGLLVAGLAAPVAAQPASRGTATPTAVPTPTVSGPVTGGNGISLLSTSFDLASVGYSEQEYFLAGTARAFTSSQPLTTDGRWHVQPASSAPYKTRIVVYRPTSAKHFNGNVVVEWMNVSAGADSAVDWIAGHTSLIRDGAAYVGVSAQAVGVQGGSGAVGSIAGGGIRAADPARYGSLSHPGDSYSYDIFSQAGLVARGHLRPDPLAGLAVHHVVAAGESQSAFRMVTYIDAVQPLDHVFDGFLVHSTWATGAPLSQAPQPSIVVPRGTMIRTDLGVPVLVFETETDLLNGYASVSQPDTSGLRVWEVAGTAHADAYTAGFGFGDTGNGQAERMLLDASAVGGGPLSCSQPINLGPAYLVLSTAMHDLQAWVATGTAPPRAPRLAVTAGPPVTIARDAHGNAVGGIRTPLLDAPAATLTGDPNAGGTFCTLFGTTTPFDAATLAALYPTHAAYVTAFDRATDQAVHAGFLLAADAANLKAAASAAGTG